MRHILTLGFCALAIGALHAGERNRQAGCGSYDFDQVLRQVEGGVFSSRLLANIEACGVTFILTDATAARLRAAGATEELIAQLSPPAKPRVGQVWRPRTDKRPMTWIPPDQFRMGSDEGEAGRDPDETAHTTVIASGFWLETTEVTNEAYRQFLMANPDWQKSRISSALHDGKYLASWNGFDYPQGQGQFPVVSVSWHAALAYAQWVGKRLPTEAEWEYAARAGATGMYWWGETFDAAKANNAEQLRQTGEVLTRNPWGLFDMLGNAAEWTSTIYAQYPYTNIKDGRERTDGSVRDRPRVVRGGSIAQAEGLLRLANRQSTSPTTTSDQIGFRCAR